MPFVRTVTTDTTTGLHMAITAKQVKDLREVTGAGMMDCKKALTETDGDVEAAIDLIRKKGLGKAEKKASRIAAEGTIFLAKSGERTVMVEVNSETDFVAKDSNFIEFGERVAAVAAEQDSDDIEALMACESDGETLEARRQALVAKIGENIQVRRSYGASTTADDAVVASYVHGGAKIGVVVELEGGDDNLAKDVAMHVAALNPGFVDSDSVSPEVLEKERAFLIDEASSSGKPAEIVEKMVQGRVQKYLKEICLVSQVFVKTNDGTVGDLLKKGGAKCKGFTRFEVGDGIEKKEEDFAAEVAAAAAG